MLCPVLVHPMLSGQLKSQCMQHRTCTYKQLQVLMILFMKSKFGKFYRIEFCTEFFSYSSQTSDGSRPNCWQVHGRLSE